MFFFFCFKFKAVFNFLHSLCSRYHDSIVFVWCSLFFYFYIVSGLPMGIFRSRQTSQSLATQTSIVYCFCILISYLLSSHNFFYVLGDLFLTMILLCFRNIKSNHYIYSFNSSLLILKLSVVFFCLIVLLNTTNTTINSSGDNRLFFLPFFYLRVEMTLESPIN